MKNPLRATVNKAPAPMAPITPESPVPYAQFALLAQSLTDMSETLRALRRELVESRAVQSEMRQALDDLRAHAARNDATLRHAVQEVTAVARTYTAGSIAREDDARTFRDTLVASMAATENGPIATSPATIASGEQGIAYIARHCGLNRRTVGKRLAESATFATLRDLSERAGDPLTRNVRVMRWLADAPAYGAGMLRYQLLAQGEYTLESMRAKDAAIAAQSTEAAA